MKTIWIKNFDYEYKLLKNSQNKKYLNNKTLKNMNNL